MNPSVLARTAVAGAIWAGSIAVGHGGQKPGQPTPPSAITVRVDFFESTQRWFEVVRAHQIGASDASVATVAGLTPVALERIRQDLHIIHGLLDAAATKGSTSVDAPGRTLRLKSLEPLMRLAQGALDLPASGVEELARLRDPDNHARQVISRIMTQAAMLHTRAGMQLEESGVTQAADRTPASGAVRIGDGQQSRVRNLSAHWAIAREAFDIVGPPRAGSPTARIWYRVASEYLQQQLNYAALVPHLEQARALFPQDARVFLFSGAAYENLAAPRVQSAVGDGTGPLPGVSSRDDLLKEAERYLRRALELDTAMTLARIRLGRVLDLTGRHDEAADLLQQAESRAPDSINGYLASLYLGHAEELRGHDEDARAAYQRASALFPRAQSPTLALAALSWRTKSQEAAAAGLRTLPARSLTSVLTDPWWYADASHVGNVSRLLAQLHESALEAVK